MADELEHLRELGYSDMLAHYSRALDEIYRLRCALAHEATKAEAALGYRTLPDGLRAPLRESVERMRTAARGENAYTDLSSETKEMALRLAGAPTGLTRGTWEAQR